MRNPPRTASRPSTCVMARRSNAPIAYAAQEALASMAEAGSCPAPCPGRALRAGARAPAGSSGGVHRDAHGGDGRAPRARGLRLRRRRRRRETRTRRMARLETKATRRRRGARRECGPRRRYFCRGDGDHLSWSFRARDVHVPLRWRGRFVSARRHRREPRAQNGERSRARCARAGTPPLRGGRRAPSVPPGARRLGDRRRGRAPSMTPCFHLVTGYHLVDGAARQITVEGTPEAVAPIAALFAARRAEANARRETRRRRSAAETVTDPGAS